jgi:putative ABC transport system substrate-binding protein
MRRREFITFVGGAAAAWPLAAHAQQSERTRNVGVLVGLREDDPDTQARLVGLREGLEKLGWSEGRNIRIHYRFAPPGTQTQVLAKELVALQPDVLLCQASPATRALQEATRTIPIVFVGVADPIGQALSEALQIQAAIPQAFSCSRLASPESGWRCLRTLRRVSCVPLS